MGTAPNRGEARKAHIDAAFQLLTSKAGRRFVYDTVCSAISDPERLTYEVALVISGRTRDDHVRAEEVFGDVSELVLEEARERLAREPEEVLDELDREGGASPPLEECREPEKAKDEFDSE